MQKLKSTQTILLRWIAAYLMVLLIPLGGFVYSSTRTTAMLRQQTSDASQVALGSLKNELDTQFTAMASIYTMLMRNEYFTKTLYASELDITFRVEYAQNVIRALNQCVASAGSDLGVTIYYTDKQYMITNKSAYDLDAEYYVQQMAGSKLSLSEWSAMLSQPYGSFEYFISPEFRLDSHEQCIVMATSLRLGRERVNLFVTLPLRELSVFHNRLTDRYLLLTEPDGSAAAAFAENPPVTAVSPTLTSGTLVAGADGRRYICDTVQSDVSAWRYTLVTSEKRYWSQLRAQHTVMLVTALVALGLGLAVAAFFLRANYRPVEKIMKQLNPQQPHRNEFEVIDQSLRSLTAERRSLHRTLEEQQREQYLLSLLRGRKMPLPGCEFNAQFHIAEPDEQLALVVFAVGVNEETRLAYHSEQEYESMNFYALNNVFSELMADYSYYRLEDGRLLIYLLHLTPAQLTRWREENMKLLRRICDLFDQSLRVPVSAALSGETADLDRLGTLYRDSSDALDYQATIGGSGVVLVSDYLAQTANELPKGHYDASLSAAIAAGNSADAQRIVDELFAEYRQNTAITFPVFRIRVTELLYALLDTYYELISDPDPRQRLVLRMEQVIAAHDEHTLYESLCDLLRFACASTKLAAAGVNGHLVNEVCAFVRAHHTDNNLNIAAIADEFGRNPQSLSRIFHTQMQKGLLDYINEVRVEHAKTLLADPRLSMEEVAEAVGFSCVRTFRRAFSRFVGMSPSEFHPIDPADTPAGTGGQAE